MELTVKKTNNKFSLKALLESLSRNVENWIAVLEIIDTIVVETDKANIKVYPNTDENYLYFFIEFLPGETHPVELLSEYVIREIQPNTYFGIFVE